MQPPKVVIFPLLSPQFHRPVAQGGINALPISFARSWGSFPSCRKSVALATPAAFDYIGIGIALRVYACIVDTISVGNI